MMRRSFGIGGVLVVAVLLLGVGSASAAAKTRWLCKPGLKDNPCEPSLDTTIFSPAGATLRVERIRPQRSPKVDCFYVYPTVSDEPGLQAPLRTDPEQRSIALYQAARYSRYCRVYAPIYRQLTLSGIGNPSVSPEIRATAYADVRAAWRTYLRKLGRGRGVVLIALGNLEELVRTQAKLWVKRYG
jgi:hypothetical protein